MAVDLHKKAERAGITLKKRGMENPPRIRVGGMFDISGSMQGLYTNNVDGEGSTVQHVVNHTLGLAMALDPTHILDMFVFDDQHAQLPIPATPQNYGNYVRSQILTEDAIPKWGSTQYAGVMHQFQDHYFGEHPDHVEHRRGRAAAAAAGGFFSRLFGRKAPVQQTFIAAPADNTPVLGLLYTDGDNSDHYEAEIAASRSLPYPVFWSLVGVGNHSFRFLRHMHSQYPNCEFVNMSDFHLTDEELYAQLVSEKLVNWLKTHQA